LRSLSRAWVALESSGSRRIGKDLKMGTRARGTFEVEMKPQPLFHGNEGAGLARMSLAKRFHGDMEGESAGEMLSAGNPAKGSAAYVAIEQVTATLQGRSGTFVLQHAGTMTPRGAQLIVTVVPDSGTGQLEGISGTVAIRIEDGRHSYEFDYDLP
jgi:hypothetical protein